jgi:arsenate reductase
MRSRPTRRACRYLDWDLPDPAGLDLDAIHPIRDDINHRVQELLTELVPAQR